MTQAVNIKPMTLLIGIVLTIVMTVLPSQCEEDKGPIPATTAPIPGQTTPARTIHT